MTRVFFCAIIQYMKFGLFLKDEEGKENFNKTIKCHIVGGISVKTSISDSVLSRGTEGERILSDVEEEYTFVYKMIPRVLFNDSVCIC